VASNPKSASWTFLDVHVIGALVHGGSPCAFTALKEFRQDANLTVEVLRRVFVKSQPLPKRIRLQFDNCVRENKNLTVIAYVAWLVQSCVFDEVPILRTTLCSNYC
jgi:hypothetical protein